MDLANRQSSIQRTLVLVIWLSILPLALLATQIWAIFNRITFWRQIADPAYQYLLNGVAIISGVMPGHTDHPGTSTQWLNGIVQWGYFNLFGHGETLIADAVARPEVYLRADAVSIVVLQFLAFLLASWRVTIALGLPATLVFQAIAIPTAPIFLFTTYPIPESTVWLATLLLLALIAPLAKNPRASVSISTALLIGLVTAIGATAKIVFVPIVLLLVVWLRVRDLVMVLISAAVSGLVIMWPVRDQFERMWNWFFATASTSARYPDEEQTSSGLQSLVSSPPAILSQYPLLAVALLLMVGSVAALIFGSADRKSLVLRLVGPLAAMAGVWVLTYKAWRPNDLMVMGLLGALLAAIAFYSVFIDETGFPSLRRPPIAWTSSVVIFAISVITFFVSVPSDVTSRSATTAYDDQIDFLENKRLDGAYIAAGYGVFSEISALTFANGSSNKIAAVEIADQYPRWIDFSIWNSMFYIPTQDGSVLETCQTIEQMVRSPKGLLLAPGREIDISQPTSQYSSLTVVPEARFGDFEVLRVLAIECPST